MSVVEMTASARVTILIGAFIFNSRKPIIADRNWYIVWHIVSALSAWAIFSIVSLYGMFHVKRLNLTLTNNMFHVELKKYV